MGERAGESTKTGPEVGGKLRELFGRWAREENEGGREGEPSWEEVRRALNEGRPADGKPLPEEE